MIPPPAVAAAFRLRELLARAEVSQSEFARVSGLSFATINRLSNHPPDQVALETVGKALAGFHALGHDFGVSDLIEWAPPRRRGAAARR